jgi:hypothetical protein
MSFGFQALQRDFAWSHPCPYSDEELIHLNDTREPD